MIKELRYFFYIIIIFFFIFFTIRYYFSDINKKIYFRSLNEISINKINNYSKNLKILKNDTENIVEYVVVDKNKIKKKYSFWRLLNKND